MKKLILILLAIMPLYCYAETPRVQNVEGELRAGLNFPTFGASSFFTFAIELRHNIKNTPWDCGITAEIDIMGRDNDDFAVLPMTLNSLPQSATTISSRVRPLIHM